MKKTMYLCDLCGNELEPFYKGAGIIHRAYEISVKYPSEFAYRKKIDLLLCPKCLDEIRERNCKK